MNKRDLKRLKIDSSFVISPERFIAMFGIECDNIKKINIHDLHYILGKNLNHAGVNQISLDSLYRGDILLIGTPNNFKAYYRPIVYKVKVNNIIEETIPPVKSDLDKMSLHELCELCLNVTDIEEFEKILTEIYFRSRFDYNKELDTKDYVLGKFNREEKDKLNEIYRNLVNVIDDFCNISLEMLKSKYNSK